MDKRPPTTIDIPTAFDLQMLDRSRRKLADAFSHQVSEEG
jgi:hypothetical protein